MEHAYVYVGSERPLFRTIVVDLILSSVDRVERRVGAGSLPQTTWLCTSPRWSSARGTSRTARPRTRQGAEYTHVWNNRTRITTYFFLYRAVLHFLFVVAEASGKIVADPGVRCDLFRYLSGSFSNPDSFDTEPDQDPAF